MQLSRLLAAAVAVATAPLVSAQIPTFHYRAGGECFGVAFVDADFGMVTRDGGGARYTSDGGLTWLNSTTPDAVRGQLRHVFVLDDEDIWTVGNGGHVLHTANLGSVWSHVNPSAPVLNRLGQPAALFDVWMHDTLNGIAVGEKGTLASTSDGGASWSSITLPTDFYDPTSGDSLVNVPGDIYRIHFYDEDDALLVADRGRILESTDGGSTWTSFRLAHYCEFFTESNVELWDIAVEGTATWIVGGHGFNNGHTFRRAYNGDTWNHIHHLVPMDATTLGQLTTGSQNDGGWPTFYGVAPIGTDEVVVISYGSGVLDYSSNGSGSLDAVDRCNWTDTPAPTTLPTWIQVETPAYTGQQAAPSRPPLNAIATIGSQNRWITGQFGKILRWDDSQTEWVQCGTPHDGQHRFYSADQIDEDTVVVAAQGHRVLKSVDGGRSFSTAYIGASNGDYMTRVAMSRAPSSGLGLAVGSGSFAVRSDDSADTWSPINSPQVALRSLCFAGSTDTAYVGGPDGDVFRTDVSALDGSSQLTWTAVPLPSPEHVNGLASVENLSGHTGYAVTEDMNVWLTTDSGSTWSDVPFLTSPPSPHPLLSVATFGDGSKAVAVGVAGVVMVRNGARFEYVDLSSLIGTTTLHDVAVSSDGTTILAVGTRGTVVRFQGTTFADALVTTNWSTPKSGSSDAELLAVRLDAADHGYIFGRMAQVLEYD